MNNMQRYTRDQLMGRHVRMRMDGSSYPIIGADEHGVYYSKRGRKHAIPWGSGGLDGDDPVYEIVIAPHKPGKVQQ